MTDPDLPTTTADPALAGTGSRPGVRLVLWAVLVLAIGALVGALLWQRAAHEPLPRYDPMPAFTFTDRDGEPFGTGELAGGPWILDFVFTRCPGVCPRMTETMAGVEARLPDDPRLRLVSISVDPDYDTPERLQAYAETYDAPARWHFLTGPRPRILTLAEALGLPVNVDPDLPITDPRAIMHSSRFLLIDEDGVVRGYYSSLDQAAMDELVEDATRLLRGS